jgi:glutamine amidotransferase
VENMIVIIDYGMGNLRSVQKALERAGALTCVSQNPKDIEKAGKIVLPGVGAMKPAMEKLRRLNLDGAVKEAVLAGKIFLGICLGLQLLFEESDEGENGSEGLGILSGRVEKFPLKSGLKIPHMGWNQLKFRKKECPLLKGIKDGENVYFCHSYYVKPKNSSVIAAQTDYGMDFTSAVWSNNIFGVQFHPEKSQTAGLTILKNFVELKS